MSLLDTIGSLLGKADGSSTSVPEALVAALSSQEGAVGGLIQKFESAGLGGVIASWIGTGENQPVAPDALHGILGSDLIQQISEKTGLPINELLPQIAQHLPGIVLRLLRIRDREEEAIVLPQAKSATAESQETGLWLWQGEAPTPQSRPEPLSRGRVILDRIVAAARWTGWVAPAGVWILILLAASLVLRSTAPDKRISADTRAESPQPGSTLIAPHALIPPPSVELPDVGLDQLRMPPAAFAQIMAQPAEGQMVKRRAQRRSPPSVRRTHAAFARNSDAFWRPYSAHVGPAVDGDTHY